MSATWANGVAVRLVSKAASRSLPLFAGGLDRSAHAWRGFPCHHSHRGHGLVGRAGVEFLTALFSVHAGSTRKDQRATLQNDMWVGLFVMLGAVALVFLALQSANLLSFNFQRLPHQCAV